LNLTVTQRELIKAIVRLIRDGKLNETFIVVRNNQGGVILQNAHEHSGISISNTATQEFQALANAGLLVVEVVEPRFGLLNCTLTDEAYAAADSNLGTGVGRADARFEALVTLAAEGRALQDKHNPVQADSAFDYWVHRVTEHLKDKFSSALAIKWQSLADSPLVSGGGYYDDPATWAAFHAAVKARLAWIAQLPARMEKVRENAVDRVQQNAASSGLGEVTIDAHSHAIVDPQRVEQLKALRSEHFDFSKLIRLCEELNVAFATESYFAAAMLTRAVVDHVPPIFGVRTFAEVANNYAGSKSFKASMKTLEQSSRNIADQHLHCQIRAAETIPTATQINFSNDLDVLLGEIVRLNTRR